MPELSINDLLTKAEKSETISFFGEILTFIKEIKPVLDKINSSIEENIKKMPAAANKISKVTEATELATTEILDIVDRIFPKIDSVTEKLKESHNEKLEIHKKILQFLQSIEKGISGEIDLSSLLPDIQSAIGKQQNIIEDFNEDSIKQSLDDLQTLSSDATSIMISLQVQDITSQQLAAVKHLLDTIQNRLSNINKKFRDSDIQHFLDSSTQDDSSDNITTLHKEIAFDPNAVDSYDDNIARQDMVDDLFDNASNTILNDDSKEKTSSEDIDESIGQQDTSKVTNTENSTDEQEADIKSESLTNQTENSNNAKEESKENIETEKVSSDEDEKMDTEDIDAMFSNDLDDDEEISQDDIDKLFAGS